MAALTKFMAKFCAGGDDRLMRRGNRNGDPGIAKDRDYNDTKDVNARPPNQHRGSKRKHVQGSRRGPSTLDQILDKPCAIQGAPDSPATHSNQNCWVIKQAGKIAADYQDRGRGHSSNKAQHGPGSSSQKEFPSDVKDINMVYPTHIQRRQTRTSRHTYGDMPKPPRYKRRSDFLIIRDLQRNSEELHHGDIADLILDTIIDGFHLTRVLMDCSSSFNLLYADIVRDMYINTTRIRLSDVVIEGSTPGNGSKALEVSP